MKEKMKYKMLVIIAEPNSPEGIADERVVKLDALFVHDPEECGNGYYVLISVSEFDYEDIDLRYDVEFDPNNKASYLEKWARNYWNVEDDGYYVKWLKITPTE